jgi:hypothetical protein
MDSIVSILRVIVSSMITQVCAIQEEIVLRITLVRVTRDILDSYVSTGSVLMCSTIARLLVRLEVTVRL